MILKSFLFKKMKYWIVGFSALAVCLCSLSPSETVYAAGSGYSLGCYGYDGIVYQSDYGAENYFDLLCQGLSDGLASYYVSRGIEISPSFTVPTASQFKSFFRTNLSEIATLWDSEGWNPTWLCNVYVLNRSNDSFNGWLLFQFLKSDYSFNTSGYFDSHYSFFGLPVFLPYNGPNSSNGLFFYANGYLTSNPVSLRQDNSYTVGSHVPQLGNFNSFDIAFGTRVISIDDGSLINQSSLYLSAENFHSPHNTLYYYSTLEPYCLVSSFPVFLGNTKINYIFLSNYLSDYLGLSFPSDISEYNFELSSWNIYSGTDIELYPKPTPIPTIIPTLSPTPLPLAYDSNIDSFEDGETLGFLNFMTEKLSALPSTFSGAIFVSEVIGYIYHYCPWASVLLFIPVIGFFSFLIGRNKS